MRHQAVRDGLSRIWSCAHRKNPALALEPDADAEIRQLEALLDAHGNDDAKDTEYGPYGVVRLTLGWLYWFRYRADDAEPEGPETMDAAVELLGPWFSADMDELPMLDEPGLGKAASEEALLSLRNALEAQGPEALADAVHELRRVLRTTTVRSHWRADVLAALGTGLGRLHRFTRDPENLEEAVRSLQEAVDRCLDPDAEVRYLEELASVLTERAMTGGDRADVYAAETALRRSVESTLPRDPHRAHRLARLAGTLRLCFLVSGEEDRGALDEEILTRGEVVDATPPADRRYGHALHAFADAFRFRFTRFGDPGDLEAAIGMMRNAATESHRDDPVRVTALFDHGVLRRIRFRRGREAADLDAAIDAFREAAETAGEQHRTRGAEEGRATGSGTGADTDSAATRRRDALNMLGASLRDRFERTARPQDLDESVTAFEQAVDATPHDADDRAKHLFNLALVRHQRYDVTGDTVSLDQAIEGFTAAYDATAEDDPARAAHAAELGAVLRARFERRGDLTDVDTAVRVLREAAVAVSSADGEGDGVREEPRGDRGYILDQLGCALSARFERLGTVADADAALAAGREAVAAALPGDRAVRLSNLGVALRARYARLKDPADLDEAVDVLRAAVDATPDGRPGPAGHLSNLAVVLYTRFQVGEAADDLDAAIDAGRRAVELTPAGHPLRPRYLSNLGIALRARYEGTEEPADLDASIDTTRDAVDTTPGDHPGRTHYLANLGAALLTRNGPVLSYEHGRLAGESSQDALASYTEVARSPLAPPTVRIRAAMAAGRMLAWPDAAEGAEFLELAVRLLPGVAPRRIGRGDQQEAVGEFAGLAGDAAAFTLMAIGRPLPERAAHALSLLEAGRGVLLGQALETRGDLTELRRLHPDLAARFTELRDRLDETPEQTDPYDEPRDPRAAAARWRGSATDDRHRLARELTATLARIREADGFSGFGLPPTAHELRAAADEGPVVVFNVSVYAVHALLLTDSGVDALHLDRLDGERLSEVAEAFHTALRTLSERKDKTEQKAAQKELTRILEWLWDHVTEPVLSALGFDRRPQNPDDASRLWWVPSGPLTQLPLHAAGYHTDAADDPCRRTVLDRVVTSNAPTVRALHHARGRAAAAARPNSALVVAMPTTPGHGRLEHAVAEARAVCERLPDPMLLMTAGGRSAVPDTAPTKAGVLDLLPGCQIAHFACHAESDATDPSRSRLLLRDHADDPLSVAGLAPVVLDTAQLAYLSACHTAATGNERLLDESIHLTSAFQLAGFPHVVGTLWSIDDGAARTIAECFYDGLRAEDSTLDTRRAAHALRSAVRSVRDRFPRTPSLWAAHLHVGP
ncbi:CHAT domain-containing protein [Streptomyces prasinus]